MTLPSPIPYSTSLITLHPYTPTLLHYSITITQDSPHETPSVPTLLIPTAPKQLYPGTPYTAPGHSMALTGTFPVERKHVYWL